MNERLRERLLHALPVYFGERNYREYRVETQPRSMISVLDTGQQVSPTLIEDREGTIGLAGVAPHSKTIYFWPG
ncbi:hypothetical protein C8P63_12719 [Melghirimyces profundicolus]|uniref:Uncharacterized protein n=1 Tax=Melghirimyces profundicolus TaxID=1242148 RepID=A0A2T6BCA4_9BACL|nr:hypothetical protein [Melghirimyces profundicolus]PTX53699.1 hypothetical protein C8P63_12719 [Melghirimyces profundicolus]